MTFAVRQRTKRRRPKAGLPTPAKWGCFPLEQPDPHSAGLVVAIELRRLAVAGLHAKVGIMDKLRHQRASPKDCISATSASTCRASRVACSAAAQVTASGSCPRWSAAARSRTKAVAYSDRQAAEKLATAERLDMAMDLSGWANRCPVFALVPASSKSTSLFKQGGRAGDVRLDWTPSIKCGRRPRATLPDSAGRASRGRQKVKDGSSSVAAPERRPHCSFSRFFRCRANDDDVGHKVYAHIYPRADADGKHAAKIGITANSPNKRKTHHASKYNLPALKAATTVWKSINRTSDSDDAKRFDRRLKADLKPYQVTSMPGTEFYRGKPKQLLGIVNRALAEHARGRNS